MKLLLNPTPFKLSPKFIIHLQQAIGNEEFDCEASSITLNFRDSSYSSEAGGYHPVEILLCKSGNQDKWSISYITDFAYYGFPYAELVKELDFDIEHFIFTTPYSKPMHINHESVKDMFNLWQRNFLTYLEFDAYDQVEVSAS
ncbi:DUF2787 domain-containing protein [Vibrio aestuarianus]|uniref:DUF2787 family protein n=1 Tax=Vibrio aestuarianus TaxID=28171 RepID=UPI00237D2E3D|nr:DUF2787 family protein [Vibrio aestuarianus]MDE1348527.1 DUF2787 domain-containing protein [Vibrio aestuarianus]